MVPKTTIYLYKREDWDRNASAVPSVRKGCTSVRKTVVGLKVPTNVQKGVTDTGVRATKTEHSRKPENEEENSANHHKNGN